MSSIKIFSLPNHLRVEERSANKTVIDKKKCSSWVVSTILSNFPFSDVCTVYRDKKAIEA